MSSTFADTYISQNFSLPNSLIYNIFHESCTAFKKLLLCCKYFYLKYKIIPNEFLPRYMTCDETARRRWGFHYDKDYDHLPARLWLFGEIKYTNPSKIIQLIPKIYRCDIISLKLSGEAHNFDDVKILFSSKNLQQLICISPLLYFDGSIVPVEKVFETVPYVNDFVFSANSSKGFTPQSAHKLAAMVRLTKINMFAIFDVPENFNLHAFIRFLENNVSDISRFIMRFDQSIKEEIRGALKTKFRMSLEDLAYKFRIQGKTFYAFVNELP